MAAETLAASYRGKNKLLPSPVWLNKLWMIMPMDKISAIYKLKSVNNQALYFGGQTWEPFYPFGTQ